MSRVRRAPSPEQGAIVMVTMPEVRGGEETGSRPALVVSPKRFTDQTRLLWVAPITAAAAPGALHVELPSDLTVGGYVQLDQIHTLDLSARTVTVRAQLPADLLDDYLARIIAILKAD